MPDGLVTLLDIAKGNGLDVEGYVEEVIVAVPELALLPVETIQAQSYTTLVRTANPTVAFRNGNEGATASKGTYEPREVSCKILNPTWNADKAIADVWPRGPEDYIAMEGVAMLNAAFTHVCSQMYYGSSNDSKGFQGLASFVDAALVIDATGSTANTGSSVWALKFGPRACSLVVGGNGKLDLSDVRIGDAYDANNKRFTAYIQEMLTWVGMQVMTKYSCGRIKNLTAQNGKGLTDSLLSQLLETFPTGHTPDAFVMSRRSRSQLQRSRTATNATGAEAPLPTSFEGIPIVTSETIVNTEAIS